MKTREQLNKKLQDKWGYIVTDLTDEELLDLYEELENEHKESLESGKHFKGRKRKDYADESRRLRSIQNHLYPELAHRKLVNTLQRKLNFKGQTLYHRFIRWSG